MINIEMRVMLGQGLFFSMILGVNLGIFFLLFSVKKVLSALMRQKVLLINIYMSHTLRSISRNIIWQNLPLMHEKVHLKERRRKKGKMMRIDDEGVNERTFIDFMIQGKRVFQESSSQLIYSCDSSNYLIEDVSLRITLVDDHQEVNGARGAFSPLFWSCSRKPWY